MSSAFIPITLTEKCQWNCHYCDFPTIQNPKTVTLDKVKEWIPKILDTCDPSGLSLVGGELGLINEEIMDSILTDCSLYQIRKNKASDKCDTLRIIILTNGLYFETHKESMQKVYPYLDILYVWHVTTEIGAIPIQKMEDDSNIVYTFVIHKGNVDKVETFLQVNPDMFFVPLIYLPKKDTAVANSEYDLTEEQLVNLRGILSKYPKNIGGFIHEPINNLLNYTKDDLSAIRKLCSHVQPQKDIDLVNDRIKHCCVNYTLCTTSIPLTEENLIKFVVNNEYFGEDVLCSFCQNFYYPVTMINMTTDRSLLTPEQIQTIKGKYVPFFKPMNLPKTFKNMYTWHI